MVSGRGQYSYRSGQGTEDELDGPIRSGIGVTLPKGRCIPRVSRRGAVLWKSSHCVTVCPSCPSLRLAA